MSGIEKLTAELRAGLEGVTPGPWRMEIPDLGYCQNLILTEAPEFAPTENQPWKHLVAESDNCSHGEGNAAHFARCNPVNIFALLDALATLQDEKEKLEKENEALRAALEAQPSLPYVVEYRRADAVIWAPMAAFDSEGVAERYAKKCGEESFQWEYRARALSTSTPSGGDQPEHGGAL